MLYTTFQKPDWGAHYSSAKNIGPKKKRIVLFASTFGGISVLNSVCKFIKENRDEIEIIGLVTDDPTDKNSRISAKKRIWKFFSENQKKAMVDYIIKRAISMNIDVFTGNVKSNYFKQLFEKWEPDLILVACFGQILPSYIFNYPSLGAFNLHPSDIKNNIGAGSKPFEDTLNKKYKYSRVTLLRITDTIDAGPIIGRSPLIRITNFRNKHLSNICLLDEKVTSIFSVMTRILLKIIFEKYNRLNKSELEIDYEKEIPLYTRLKLLLPIKSYNSLNYPLPKFYTKK